MPPTAPVPAAAPAPDQATAPNDPVTGLFRGLSNWFTERAPGLAPVYRKHMTEYFAPKNFNFWYYMGSLALLILVMQIVTGIFLTMHFKPSAAEAFASSPITIVLSFS